MCRFPIQCEYKQGPLHSSYRGLYPSPADLVECVAFPRSSVQAQSAAQQLPRIVFCAACVAWCVNVLIFVHAQIFNDAGLAKNASDGWAQWFFQWAFAGASATVRKCRRPGSFLAKHTLPRHIFILIAQCIVIVVRVCLPLVHHSQHASLFCAPACPSQCKASSSGLLTVDSDQFKICSMRAHT